MTPTRLDELLTQAIIIKNLIDSQRTNFKNAMSQDEKIDILRALGFNIFFFAIFGGIPVVIFCQWLARKRKQ